MRVVVRQGMRLCDCGAEMRRVVVTGMGALCPLGATVQEAWGNVVAGRCGLSKLEGPEYAQLPCRVAGFVQANGVKFELQEHFSKSQLRSMAPATGYALLAAAEALGDAGLLQMSQQERERTGVAVGMGMIDLQDVCATYQALQKGYHHVSPFFVPRILPNLAAGQISIKYGFQGPNHAVSTACATGAHAIGDSFRFIQTNSADVMVCGGTEACISPLAIAAFCRLRALSTSFNDAPLKASRPFDKNRDGFVMGEGSAILVLEELERAQRRGARIYAEVLGYGLSGDAAHLTAPSQEGAGAFLAMQRALQDAQLRPEDVGYVNAHATSTPMGDAIEIKAIQRLLGVGPAVSSTKGAHGHLLGAAGNLEAVFTVKAIEEGVLPPTINLVSIEDPLMNFVAQQRQPWGAPSGRIALKNAFGFGGTNASLCLGQWQAGE